MNHYPHHIGDFNSATRHLTRVERSLYRDLIELYYDTEQPLKSDFDKLARKVIAVTDEERQALAAVLDEFFVLLDDGWHNSRCDAEIAKYQSQVEQASRAGRASAAKRSTKPGEAGKRPLNDRSTTDERPFNDRATNQNQNQNQNQSSMSSHSGDSAQTRGDDELKPKDAAQWIEVFASEFGVDVDHRSVHDRKKFMPLAAGWVSAGLTVAQMRCAVAKARAEATEPIAYLPAYVDRVLASVAHERGPPAEPAWRRENRERIQQAVPGIAAQAPGPEVIDVEAKHVPAASLG